MQVLLCVGGFDSEILDIVTRQCEYVDMYDPHEAVEYFAREKESVDAVLMSLRMNSDMNGLEAMEQIHRIDPEVPIIISTHDTGIKTIVDAMQRGAYNYLYEPRVAEELPYVLTRAFSYMNAIRENRTLKKEHRSRGGAGRLIGSSASMANIRHTIENVADSSLPVLFTGESGTGKEVAARALHDLSPRGDSRFIAVNCGAFSPSLLEAELFGYEKGAFTGADTSHAGLFEQADNSTLFLDEIGLSNTDFQVKLLRALEHGEIRRIGDETTRRVDVRVITATNEDLEQGVEQGTFRKDLLYRLNVITIDIPPLRERREDIALLAHVFLTEVSEDSDAAPSGINSSALEVLEQYEWPGNGRELRNVIQRAALLCRSNEIRIHDLPETITDFSQQVGRARDNGLNRVLADTETRLIKGALRAVDGNRTRAAEKLAINRTTLIEKMKRLGIQ